MFVFILKSQTFIAAFDIWPNLNNICDIISFKTLVEVLWNAKTIKLFKWSNLWFSVVQTDLDDHTYGDDAGGRVKASSVYQQVWQELRSGSGNAHLNPDVSCCWITPVGLWDSSQWKNRFKHTLLFFIIVAEASNPTGGELNLRWDHRWGCPNYLHKLLNMCVCPYLLLFLDLR